MTLRLATLFEALFRPIMDNWTNNSHKTKMPSHGLFFNIQLVHFMILYKIETSLVFIVISASDDSLSEFEDYHTHNGYLNNSNHDKNNHYSSAGASTSNNHIMTNGNAESKSENYENSSDSDIPLRETRVYKGMFQNVHIFV